MSTHTNGRPCLDAETLAAWVDNGLTRRERAAAEAHAADCARCREVLAAIVRSTPSGEATSRPWAHRVRALDWLVPLMAAATVIAVWVAVPREGPPRSPAQAIDEIKVTRRDVPIPSETRETAEPSLQAQRAPADAREESRAKTALAKERALSDRASSSSDKVTRGQPWAPPAVSTPQSAAAPAVSPERKAMASPQLKMAQAETVAIGTEIVSADGSARWRIAGTNVQRSVDGGSTWETQRTGADAPLAAGASPAPTVCWMVGARGTVLLSTDGRSWRRVPFPEVTDLVAVRATNDKTATVSSSDGRTFSTSDGGLTWTGGRSLL